MKKLVLTLLIGVSTLTAFAQVPSYVPTNGLVGYWPFNGNANDESGNNNNGTVNGATLTNDRNGVANKAYSFDGLNDNILINNNFFNNGWSEFTVSIWYNLNQQPNSNNGNSSHILFNTKPHHGIALTMNWGSSNKYSLFLGDGAPSNSWNAFFNSKSTQTISLNTWRHIVINKIAKKYYLYIDGNLDVIWDSPILVQSYLTKLYFGSCDPLNSSEVINGKLDDIAIFNRALTQQEITVLYTGCSTPTATITPQSNTTFCQGGSVVLNASTGTGYTYEWYKDGNLINGSIASTYTANQSGSYTVKVINGSCNATSSATTVTVNPNPTATINAAGVSTFCQGGSVVLNASIGSGYTYEWYKNGNIINGSTTSSYTANQSGSYTVKVINGSCNATSSATAVTVNPNPTVSLSLANFIHIKE